tara:strand:+ start:680 stop:2452 length:1773 start_codon:yes stop_codon:yes gene_type:complete
MGDKVIATYDQNVIDKMASSISKYRPPALSKKQKMFNGAMATNTYDTYKNLGKLDIDANGFDDQVKTYFAGRSKVIYDIKNLVQTGDMDAVEGARLTNQIEAELTEYSNIRGNLATTTMMFHDLGVNGNKGNLSKLNDPEMEMLFSEIYKDQGTVTLQNIDGKMALVGKGQVENPDTGAMEDWDYTLNLSEYKAMLEKTGNAQGQGGSVVIQAANIDDETFGLETIVDNLRNYQYGQILINPDDKEGKVYYNYEALKEWMYNPSNNALDVMMSQGINMASLWADWMPTQPGYSDALGSFPETGGMKDVAVDSDKFMPWETINKYGEKSEQYTRAENFMINYILGGTYNPDSKEGMWEGSTYFDPTKMLVPDPDSPSGYKPAFNYNEQGQKVDNAQWKVDEQEYIKALGINEAEVISSRTSTDYLPMSNILDSYEYKDEGFTIDMNVSGNALELSLNSLLPTNISKFQTSASVIDSMRKNPNVFTQADIDSIKPNQMYYQTKKASDETFTQVPPQNLRNPFKLMKWVEGETDGLQNQDKIEAITLQLQNDFRDTEYAVIDKFLENTNNPSIYSENDAKEAKERIEKIIAGL